MTKLYYQVTFEQIKKDIKSGVFRVGELLPNEQQLMEKYSVSRTTLRKAIRMLSDEGMVDVRQGRGTLVLDRRAEQDYTHVTSVTESLEKRGYTVTTKGLYIDRAPIDMTLREIFHPGRKEQINRVQRVQCADGKPVAIMVNYIPESVAPGLLERHEQITALYRYLEEHYDFIIHHTEDTIYARGCSLIDAEVLGQEPGTPMIHVDRICYNDQNEPIDYDRVRILADWYQIHVTTTGRRREK